MAKKSNLFQRLLHIEPGIALGQWVWDRIANNWVLLASAFGGLGGMSYLAAISDFLEPYGPAGIGAVGIASFLVLWVGFGFVRYLSAIRREKLSLAEATDKWKEGAKGINPLEKDFQKERILVNDLAHPILKRISGKVFYECELIGPANLLLVNDCRFYNSTFSNCDIVVVQQHTKIPINNAIAIENMEFNRTIIFGCTLFIHQDLVGVFREMGAPFVTLTGDSSIDNQQLSNMPT